MEQLNFLTKSHNPSLNDEYFIYRQLVKDLPTAVYICDAEGLILFYNEAATSLWGQKPEIGKSSWCGSWKMLTTEGNPIPFDTCQMAMTIKEGRAVIGSEIIIERPDGTRCNVQPHPQPIFNNLGIVIGALNILVDITKQKNDLRAFRESEERFRIAADTAPVMIWMSGPDKLCTFFNKGWYEFTGSTIEKELGDGWTRNIHPDDKDRCITIYNSSFDARINFRKEYRLRRYDGDFRWVMCNGVPRYSPDGIFLGYAGSCSDIHEKKIISEEMERKVEERTAELKKKNEELERSNSELASFSYIASHDLQEPLRKIITFSDKLLTKFNENIPEEGKEYLNRIITSSERMTRLIEDVLNFSRVSADEKFVNTDLNEIVKNVLTDFDQRILEKKAVIRISDLPVITAVPIQMRQLFYNLISNALKFSAVGTIPLIHISSRLLTHEEVKKHSRLLKDNAYCEILVKDNGIGFSQKFAEQIFTIFQRLHGKSEYSGTGIGLALCRKISDNHRGSISAESKEKEGATFTIVLPLKIPVAASR